MSDTINGNKLSDFQKRWQDQALEDARHAATNGKPLEMLEALNRSRFLEGMARVLEWEWQDQVPHEEIRECIARAVDKAYDELKSSKLLHNLPAWLWKTARNNVRDVWNKEYSHRAEIGDEMVDGIASHPHPLNPEEEYDRDALSRWALRKARELLPQLGQENIVKVMTYVLDAAENGITDLPHAEVGEALGLETSTVRKLVQRGFERLSRLAKEKGLHGSLDQYVRGLRLVDDEDNEEE